MKTNLPTIEITKIRAKIKQAHEIIDNDPTLDRPEITREYRVAAFGVVLEYLLREEEERVI